MADYHDDYEAAKERVKELGLDIALNSSQDDLIEAIEAHEAEEGDADDADEAPNGEGADEDAGDEPEYGPPDSGVPASTAPDIIQDMLEVRREDLDAAKAALDEANRQISGWNEVLDVDAPDHVIDRTVGPYLDYWKGLRDRATQRISDLEEDVAALEQMSNAGD